MWGNFLVIKKPKWFQEVEDIFNGEDQHQSNGWAQNNNQEWGQHNNNQGWGQQNHNQNWGNNNLNGWQKTNNNQNWGQQNNPSWGQYNNNNNQGWGQQKKNQAWGQQNNQGWGNNNNIWGQQNNTNQGWGSQKQVNFGWNDWNLGHKNYEQSNNLNCQIQKLIYSQIIQLQPSPAQKKIQQLKKYGKKFVDENFPPTQGALTGQWGYIPQWKDIKWGRISQKINNPKIFVGKPQPQDIKQGYLGDCYFLAGLAALAEIPQRILNLFLIQQIDSVCYFSVKMLYRGKWVTIDMDDYIPFIGNTPAFSKTASSQLWVAILQKAWAKLYTNYKRIEAGYPQQPLHDLTGAPIKQIYIKRGADIQTQWKYLFKATNMNYPMVCSSNPGSDTQTSQSGVVQGHAYTLLGAYVINFQGQGVRLIKLRNPWGKGQYKGKWSDGDPSWNYVNPAEKQRIGYSNNPQDGVFFIPLQIFWVEYRSITIAQVNDTWSYIYKSVKDPQQQGCYFKIQIKKQGIYSLQVDKTPQRSFEDKRQNDYRYPNTTVTLVHLDNGHIEKLPGFNSAARTSFQKYQMQPGIFLVKVLINFNPNYERDFDVNLAVYAQYPCFLSLASNQEASLLEGRSVTWSGKQDSTNDLWHNLKAYGHEKNSGWGQQNQNNGWGQSPQTGWQQPAQGNWGSSQQGWGQPQQGWGQNQQGWGQPQQGWGQPQQGWGQQQQGWGQGNGWGGSGNNGW